LESAGEGLTTAEKIDEFCEERLCLVAQIWTLFHTRIVRMDYLSCQPVTEDILLFTSLHRHPNTVEVVAVREDIVNFISSKTVGEKVIHVDNQGILQGEFVRL